MVLSGGINGGGSSAENESKEAVRISKGQHTFGDKNRAKTKQYIFVFARKGTLRFFHNV